MSKHVNMMSNKPVVVDNVYTTVVMKGHISNTKLYRLIPTVTSQRHEI